MSANIKVAVTGVGGGGGQGIMKALFSSALPIDVYPVDITPLSAGLYRGRCGGTVLPKPEEDIDAWEQWVKARGIQAIIPGSDNDLPSLAAVREDWRNRGLCEVLISDPELVEIGNDKGFTAQVLKDHGFDSPQSDSWPLHIYHSEAWLQTLADRKMTYPLVVKPSIGAASRGFHIAHNEEELLFYAKRTPGTLIQEYLPGDEYTCSVFGDSRRVVQAFMILKRTLYAGHTYRAEVVMDVNENNISLAEFVISVGNKLKPRGPLNMQLKMVPDRGPVIFELNVRCSGSTPIRAMFGYNEPEMLIRHFILGQPIIQPEIKPGVALRYWDEVIIDNATFDTLDGTQKGKVPSWF